MTPHVVASQLQCLSRQSICREVQYAVMLVALAVYPNPPYILPSYSVCNRKRVIRVQICRLPLELTFSTHQFQLQLHSHRSILLVLTMYSLCCYWCSHSAMQLCVAGMIDIGVRLATIWGVNPLLYFNLIFIFDWI